MTSIDQLLAALQGLDKTTFKNELERLKVRNAISTALKHVQTPSEVVHQHAWGDPSTTTIIKILIDVDLWKKWMQAGGGPLTNAQLSALVNVDPTLLKRFLRELAGQNLLDETEDGDTYALTDFGRALATTDLPSLYSLLGSVNHPCFANFPKFLSETQYKNPTDLNFSNANSWLGESFFSWLPKNPHINKAFNAAMTAFAANKAPWVDIYPTDSIVAAAKPDRALVVDVAGGVGHDLEKFRAKHPDTPAGSLVLQDRQNVIEAAKVKAPVTTQEVDILKGQPIQGAHVYYLHNVLHDWPDSQAVEILRNIAAVMEKGYSKILVHENVVLPKNSHPRTTIMDIVMLVFFSSSEREEKSWRSVAEQAGLKVTKIWTSPETIETIIELDLA